MLGPTPAVNEIRLQCPFFAGHYFGHKDMSVNSLLCEPPHKKALQRGHQLTYLAQLTGDSGLSSAVEIQACMLDQTVWKNCLK